MNIGSGNDWIHIRVNYESDYDLLRVDYGCGVGFWLLLYEMVMLDYENK